MDFSWSSSRSRTHHTRPPPATPTRRILSVAPFPIHSRRICSSTAPPCSSGHLPRLPAHPDVCRASLHRLRLRRASLRRPPCRSGPPRLCFPSSAVHASPRRLPRLCSPRLPAPSAAPFWSAVRGRESSAAARDRASSSPCSCALQCCSL